MRKSRPSSGVETSHISEKPSLTLLGFGVWHLSVILLASLVSVLGVVVANPVTGILGFSIALVSWASVVKLLQIANAVLVETIGDRLSGILTLRLYTLAVLLGLGITAAITLVPSLHRFENRFTPEVAVVGFFVLGTLIAVVSALVLYVFESWMTTE